MVLVAIAMLQYIYYSSISSRVIGNYISVHYFLKIKVLSRTTVLLKDEVTCESSGL